MYGRNGADQLCWALFIAELVLSLLPALVPGQAFAAFIHYTTLFLCVYLLFRMFSRNLEKRRAENRAALGVRITGFEPVTSCLSSKRSEPTELNPRKDCKGTHFF